MARGSSVERPEVQRRLGAVTPASVYSKSSPTFPPLGGAAGRQQQRLPQQQPRQYDDRAAAAEFAALNRQVELDSYYDDVAMMAARPPPHTSPAAATSTRSGSDSSSDTTAGTPPPDPFGDDAFPDPPPVRDDDFPDPPPQRSDLAALRQQQQQQQRRTPKRVGFDEPPPAVTAAVHHHQFAISSDGGDDGPPPAWAGQDLHAMRAHPALVLEDPLLVHVRNQLKAHGPLPGFDLDPAPKGEVTMAARVSSSSGARGVDEQGAAGAASRAARTGGDPEEDEFFRDDYNNDADGVLPPPVAARPMRTYTVIPSAPSVMSPEFAIRRRMLEGAVPTSPPTAALIEPLEGGRAVDHGDDRLSRHHAAAQHQSYASSPQQQTHHRSTPSSRVAGPATASALARHPVAVTTSPSWQDHARHSGVGAPPFFSPQYDHHRHSGGTIDDETPAYRAAANRRAAPTVGATTAFGFVESSDSHARVVKGAESGRYRSATQVAYRRGPVL